MGSDPGSAALIALLLGLVQGATEFLPISSSAHLYAIPYLFGISDPLLSSLAFAAVIHLGTLAAVLVALRSDVMRLLRVVLRTITSAGRHRGEAADERLILAIIIGTIPAVLLGLAAGDLLEGAVRTPLVVAGAVTAGALLLWLAERISSRERPLQSVGVVDGLMVGLAQALALIPGISRSGATISGGLFLGFRREAAARFGFLLGIPAIAGAGTIELKRLLESSEDLAAIAPLLAIGVVSAFISGLLAIKLLFRILDGGSTRIFVAYRLAFAAVLVASALLRGGL
ncbi:MAG: undecaprenyl-diphosphatase UppP [Candidatus Limnocylindrus sp.]|jgi:undecaprenyl-diphosphatase